MAKALHICAAFTSTDRTRTANGQSYRGCSHIRVKAAARQLQQCFRVPPSFPGGLPLLSTEEGAALV